MGSLLHIPFQLEHLRVEHQVNFFMGCDCHILLECRDRNNGEPAYAICAINLLRQTGREPEIEMVPIGLMFNSDPYETLIPASDPEFDDLVKKEKTKAVGGARRRRRKTRP